MYQFLFAPIQGYTDHIYRKVHEKYFSGIDEYYSPFIRMPLKNKDKKDISPENNTQKTIPQIIGGNSEETEYLINYLENLNYKRIDINLGCPFKMIVNKGRGCGTFSDMEKMKTYLKELPSDKFEISLKLRLGLDNPEQILEVLPVINSLPFHSLTIHARTGIQNYNGNPDMKSFEKVYNNCALPLFYNGDINTPEGAVEMIEKFPRLSGLMIGRGLLADPGLTKKILHNIDYKNLIQNKSGKDQQNENKYGPTTESINENLQAQHTELYGKFHNSLLKEYSDYLEGGEHQIVQKMKTVWDYFLPQTDRKILKKIKKSRTLRDYNAATLFLK